MASIRWCCLDKVVFKSSMGHATQREMSGENRLATKVSRAWPTFFVVNRIESCVLDYFELIPKKTVR